MNDEPPLIPLEPISAPLTLNVVNETAPFEHACTMELSFSAPLTTSYVGWSNEEIDETDKEKSRKKPKSKVEDSSVRKRKDTATSITNFFHRFTRSETVKDEKKIIEEEEEVERPDKLLSPDSAEETWYEPKDIVEGDLIGHEGDAELYEWSPDGLDEKIVLEHPQNMEFTNLEPVEEQGLIHQLENFRSGKMHWLDDSQLQAMRKVKEDHEIVTNLHVKISELDDADDEKLIEEMFEQMNLQMTHMHDVLDTVFPVKPL